MNKNANQQRWEEMIKDNLIVKVEPSYRGYPIIVGNIGFMIFLGMDRYSFATLQETTAFIDGWIDLKKN